MITEKITNAQVTTLPAAYTKTPVQKQISQQNNVGNLPVENEKSGRKMNAAVPLGLMTGGAFLIYYGLKKPNLPKVFNRFVKDRCFKMEKYFQEFSIITDNMVKSSFGESAAYVDNFKKTKILDIAKLVEPITSAVDAESAMKSSDEAFQTLYHSFNDHVGAGATPFDIFGGILQNSVRKVSWALDGKRAEKNILCSDLTFVPHFKNGEHSELVEDATTKLVSASDSIYADMTKYKDEKLGVVIKTQTSNMADAVNNLRNQVSDAKNTVIKSSFNNIKKLLNLGDDFTPSFDRIYNADSLTKLSPEELKPQKMPEYLNDIFADKVCWKAVKTKDFSKLDDDAVKELFYMASPYFSIKDIGIMIDRIRLKNEIDKSLGINNEKLYNTAISKLEYLSFKFRDIGVQELINKCSKDFDNLSVEQRRAKLYYIRNIYQKLGYSTVFQMDDGLLKNNPEYANLPIRKYMTIFKENPHLYFV